ncbi:hypothetical protein ACJX0J_040523, partial [Zea mays]
IWSWEEAFVWRALNWMWLATTDAQYNFLMFWHKIYHFHETQIHITSWPFSLVKLRVVQLNVLDVATYPFETTTDAGPTSTYMYGNVYYYTALLASMFRLPQIFFIVLKQVQMATIVLDIHNFLGIIHLCV